MFQFWFVVCFPNRLLRFFVLNKQHFHSKKVCFFYLFIWS